MFKFVTFFLLFFYAQTILADQSKVINEIESYLNSISSFRADFKQEDNVGNHSNGVLTFKKPFNFKIETNWPQRNIIVGNKSLIIYHDYKLNQTSHTSPDASILNLLLKDNLKLTDKNILIRKLEVDHHNIELELEAVSKHGTSSLILIFDKNPIKLRQISVQKDGDLVSMALDNTQTNIALPSSEFVFEYSKVKKPHRR